MFLLDTNVVSETRKIVKGIGSEQVKAWFAAQQSQDLYISVITLFEIERSILQLERRDKPQAAILQRWFAQKLKPEFNSRILSVDESVVSVCAALHVPDPKPEMDAMLAATASVHGFTLVTRNTKDFEPMGVRCVNPWAVA